LGTLAAQAFTVIHRHDMLLFAFFAAELITGVRPPIG
jgi:hypothetical protein